MGQKWKRWVDLELIMPLLMLALAIAFFIDVNDQPRFGRLFPQAVSVLLVVFLARSIILDIMKKLKIEKAFAAQAAEKSEIAEPEDTQPKKRKISEYPDLMRLIFIIMLFIYYQGIIMLGYMLSTAIFMVVTMVVLGYRKWLAILLTTAVFMLVVHGFFVEGFNFVLPRGTLTGF